MKKITWTEANRTHTGSINNIPTFEIHLSGDGTRFSAYRIANIAPNDDNWIGYRLTLERAKQSCEDSAFLKGEL